MDIKNYNENNLMVKEIKIDELCLLEETVTPAAVGLICGGNCRGILCGGTCGY